MKNLHVMLAAVFVLSACSTLSLPTGTTKTETTGPETAPQESEQFAFASGDVSLGSLPEARLPEKSCGMILWTLDEQRPSPVFRFVVGDRAEILIDEKIIKLKRMDYNGASGFGVFENQQFTNNEGVTVEVSSRFGLGFDGGAYLERGLIKVRATNGWSIIAPAAGIAGCRS